eukprot:CAMPEP_0176408784 /NCGR_PEP_ID=MMETSP0127-20121128/2144_1 /TAXON_ID=938130 /ORGANISM="Platyophrya macrostoma, Strain WH" /LENGTH=304 /DNA_ID=CAMNT_0017788109 /DNA_START=54 /DNA_END=968 /DNA_ORIENTATION=-
MSLKSVRSKRVTIDVYDTDLTFVILGVAPERVHHRPDAASLVPAAAGLPSYLLCPDYETEAQCPRGSQCEHFHVDTTGLVRREIHVNRAYRTLESVKYARVSTARATLSVYAPNHRQPVERVDSATLLLTAGSEAALKGEAVSVVDTAPDAPVDPTAPSHCAHFYFNRMCNRGRTCRYLHAVHLNPSAADGELAPQKPAIIGLRGRRLQVLGGAGGTAELPHTQCCNAHEAVTKMGKIDDEDKSEEVCGFTDSAPNSGTLDDDVEFEEVLMAVDTSRRSVAAGNPKGTTMTTISMYRHDPYRRW